MYLYKEEKPFLLHFPFLGNVFLPLPRTSSGCFVMSFAESFQYGKVAEN